MPGLDGLQTLAAIGSINPDITRIMLTGYATLEGAIAATNEGIDGFLTKPFDNVELRAKVREYFVRKRLKQFVSPQVLQQLQADPSYLMPRKQRATLLFVDIRGFTALTEKHDPQEWALFLSDNYFSPLGEIVFQNNGTLDKHIGDGIMAIYGAPIAATTMRCARCARRWRCARRCKRSTRARSGSSTPDRDWHPQWRSRGGHVRLGAQARIHGAGTYRQRCGAAGADGCAKSDSDLLADP